MDEGAWRTTGVVHRRRQSLALQLRPYLDYQLLGTLSQLLAEVNWIAPPFGVGVDGAVDDVRSKHLLEAQRLRAELEVGVRRVPSANLVLDRERRLTGTELNQVRLAT